MKIFLLFLIFIFVSTPVIAKDIGFTDDSLSLAVGARAMALGRAAVAGNNEVNTIFINPANLGQRKTVTLGSMYVSLLGGDVRYATNSISFPFSRISDLSLAIGYVGVDVVGIITSTQEGLNYSSYQNNVLFVGFGRQVDDDLSFGLALKLFNQGYTGYLNFLGTGQDLDIGVLYKLNQFATMGVNLRNILPSSLGGKISYPNGTEQGIPAVIKAGINLKKENFAFSFDQDIEIDRNYYPGLSHYGIEWTPSPVICLRAGLDQSISAINSGVETTPVLGVGLNFSGIRVDYAYHQYFKETANISHFISLGYVFPDIQKKEAQTVAARLASVVSGSVSSESAATIEAEPHKLFPDLIRHKVVQGDTFTDLAQKYFGDQSASVEIARFNRMTVDESLLPQNMVLIPGLRLNKYEDVPVKTDFYRVAGYLGGLRIMSEIQDGKFFPGKKITYRDLLVIIRRIKMDGAVQVLADLKSIPSVYSANSILARAGVKIEVRDITRKAVAEAIFKYVIENSNMVSAK